MWKWLAARSKPLARARGDAGEERALRFLQAHGLRLIARNFLTRVGELDLVMDDGGTVVIVEVRLRTRRDHASAAQSVDARKQRRLIRACQQFVATHPAYAQAPLRFDIVALDADAPPLWLRAAFDASEP